MSECGDVVLVQTKDCRVSNSSGFVQGHFEVKVIDATTGEALGPNSPGELCVRLSPMFLGYHQDPEETRRVVDEDGIRRIKVFRNLSQD